MAKVARIRRRTTGAFNAADGTPHGQNSRVRQLAAGLRARSVLRSAPGRAQRVGGGRLGIAPTPCACDSAMSVDSQALLHCWAGRIEEDVDAGQAVAPLGQHRIDAVADDRVEKRV